MRYAILLMLLLAACAQPVEVPQYTQEKFAEVTDTDSDLVCEISGIEYHVSGQFIYHINDRLDKIVYTPKGEYLKPKGYDRWQFRIYLDKEDNTFTNTMEYIESGKLPSDEIVECVAVDSLPLIFTNFLNSHRGLYEKEAIVIE